MHLKKYKKRIDIVIITGGLDQTKADITKYTIVEAIQYRSLDRDGWLGKFLYF